MIDQSRAFVVIKSEEGVRLDRWIKRKFPNISHNLIERLLRQGKILLNGKKTKPSKRVIFNEKIIFNYNFSQNKNLLSAEHKYKVTKKDKIFLKNIVLYEDDSLTVINKPAGIAVQGGTKIHRHIDGITESLKLVHRLDKDTSGLLLLAKNSKVANQLTLAFRERKVEKVYWALVQGYVKKVSGLIDYPLSDSGDTKEAYTRYEVLDHAAKVISWIGLSPISGRKHQLRIHCALIGHPIIGDKKYGNRKNGKKLNNFSDKLYLHACKVLIPHPEGGNLNLSAPLPDHMQKAWKLFGLNLKSFKLGNCFREN